MQLSALVDAEGLPDPPENRPRRQVIGTRKATVPTLFTLGQVVLLRDDLLRACRDGVGEVVVQESHEFFQSPGRPSPFLVAVERQCCR